VFTSSLETHKLPDTIWERESREDGMMEAWPKDTTDEDRSFRRFKDALMSYSVEYSWSFLSDEAEEAA
jgi:hypothetical protein